MTADTRDVVPVAVPVIGLCAVCESDVRVRVTGALRKHEGLAEPVCPGSGRPAVAVLPLTFRRWLSTQQRRREHVGRLARTAVRYGDDWVTVTDLAEALGEMPIAAGPDIARDLVVAAVEYAVAIGAIEGPR